jgi:hypothetical protein
MSVSSISKSQSCSVCDAALHARRTKSSPGAILSNRNDDQDDHGNGHNNNDQIAITQLPAAKSACALCTRDVSCANSASSSVETAFFTCSGSLLALFVWKVF